MRAAERPPSLFLASVALSCGRGDVCALSVLSVALCVSVVRLFIHHRDTEGTEGDGDSISGPV